MKTSQFQTGSMLLLTATLVVGGLGLLMLFPRLKPHHAANPPTANASSEQYTVAAIAQGQKYAEFYPSDFQTVRYPKLQAVNANSAGNGLAKSAVLARPAAVPTIVQAGNETTNPWTPQRSEQVTSEPSASHDPFSPAPTATKQNDTAPADNPFGDPSPTTIAQPTEPVRSGTTTSHVARHSTSTPPAGTGPFAPSSIYAPVTVHPVTVNVDSSAVAQQMQGIQDRFQQLLELQQAAERQKAAELDRRKNRRQRAELKEAELKEAKAATDELARSNQAVAQLETELSRLVAEFRELKTQTDARLQQLTVQTERTEVAEQAIVAYKKALDEAEARLAQSRLESSRMAEFQAAQLAQRPSNVVADQSFAPQESPVPPVPVQRPRQSRPFSPPPKAFTPPTPKPESQPRYFQPEPGADSQDFPTQSNVFQPDGFRMELEISDTDATTESLPPLPTLDGIPVERFHQESESVTYESQATTSRFEDDSPIAFAPQFGDDEPVADSHLNLSTTESFDDVLSPLEAIELPDTKSRVQSLNAVPNSFAPDDVPVQNNASVHDSRQVGFEHVYRFKMADVENGKTVVPADGPVCPHCGKLHNGYGKQGVCDAPLATARKTTTAKQVVTVSHSDDGAQKATTNSQTSSTARATVQSRNAARASNRHVQRSSAQSKQYLPQLRHPSLTTRKDEPGVLHRISSSLFNWRKPNVE